MNARLLLGLVLVCSVAVAHGAESQAYLTPPKTIVDILDAAPLPNVVVGPSRDVVALLYRRSMPTIAELAEPMLRLAGARINPRTNGPQRSGAITAIMLRSLRASTTGPAERKVTVPASANIWSVSFSPDGKRLSFAQSRPNGIDLWVADTATGQSRLVASGLNGTTGDPCDWLADGATLVCHFVPPARGAAPPPAQVPTGPNIQESQGKAAPVATFQDLLKSDHDERLFEYYFTSQIAAVDAATGRRVNIGRAGLYQSVSASPNGQYLLVTRNKRPFSRLVTRGAFPKEIEIWSRGGEVVKKVADLPLAENVPINGVPTGVRAARWRPDQPASIVWAEALDEGNPRNKVPHRDRVVILTAPFNAAAVEIAKTQYRFAGMQWTENGIALLTESDRPTRRTRTWVLDGTTAPRKLWDRSQEDRYGNPGTPVTRRAGSGGGPFGGGGGGRGQTGDGDRTILQNGDDILLIGTGSSPEGDRPFLDRLNLKTFATERLFRSGARSYEAVEVPLSDDGKKILTRYETPTEPPNYYVRDLAADSRRAITDFKDPAPHLTGVERQFITYTRKDGVRLSATLYLPPGYAKGERLPMLMWAYPREFTDPDAAGQVSGSPYRFTTVSGASHLLLLTQGYAILDNPTMPIVGAGETANDTYVDQLVASAQAAVDKVVEMGVADRERIGVGGHSYGAFMTANLLAHSDIFRAGIARSGAYNRSLTPFGFQNERRTFWEVPDIYMRMSPFAHAHKVNEPILLIHGEADNNSGTFPIQSERLYMALKGHGATVRYVTLPHEAHRYAARESVLHTVAEMLHWCDRWVKNAGRRPTTAGM
jgi:dipeptidyl aminopeptidase/acylaminoacyl peptidase